MDIERINYFIINSFEYDEAIAFIESIEPGNASLSKLKAGYSFFNEIVLKKALKDLKNNGIKNNAIAPKPLKFVSLEKNETILNENIKKEFSADDYKIVVKLREEKAKLWAKASSAQTMLCFTNKISERFNFARLIVENFDRHVEIMDDLMFFEDNGKLPNKYHIKELPKEDKDKIQRLYTLRTYISRYTKKLREAKTTKQKEVCQQKLDVYNFELENLNNEVKL